MSDRDQHYRDAVTIAQEKPDRLFEDDITFLLHDKRRPHLFAMILIHGFPLDYHDRDLQAEKTLTRAMLDEFEQYEGRPDLSNRSSSFGRHIYKWLIPERPHLHDIVTDRIDRWLSDRPDDEIVRYKVMDAVLRSGNINVIKTYHDRLDLSDRTLKNIVLNDSDKTQSNLEYDPAFHEIGPHTGSSERPDLIRAYRYLLTCVEWTDQQRARLIDESYTINHVDEFEATYSNATAFMQAFSHLHNGKQWRPQADVEHDAMDETLQAIDTMQRDFDQHDLKHNGRLNRPEEFIERARAGTRTDDSALVKELLQSRGLGILKHVLDSTDHSLRHFELNWAAEASLDDAQPVRFVDERYDSSPKNRRNALMTYTEALLDRDTFAGLDRPFETLHYLINEGFASIDGGLAAYARSCKAIWDYNQKLIERYCRELPERLTS